MKLKILATLFINLFLIPLSIFAQQIDVPMGFRGMMPTIEVMVNGRGPFIFAIDTGAQGLARADSSLVASLGLKPIGQAQAGDSSAQNTRTLDIVKFDSIKIGEVEFQNVPAPTRNYNTSPDLPKIDGILGFNLFADYLLTLDYPAKRIRLVRGEELPAANQKDILNFENPRGIAEVELNVGRQKIKAHIDSGNLVGGFILPTEAVEKSALDGEPVVVGKARTVSGEYEIKQVNLNETISLGGFEFTKPTVSYPAPSNANIGARILRDFAITFDQKNHRLKLEKSGWKEEAPLAKNETGQFKDYTGQYGDRHLFEETGALYIQRPNGMKLKLISLAKDEFTLENIPAARLKFTRDEAGKVFEIQILNQSGNWEKVKKD